MRTLRDFQCPFCTKITERLVEAEIETIACPCCESDAGQLIGMPTVRLEGVTGAFPGAHDRWARIREDNARIKAKKSYNN